MNPAAVSTWFGHDKYFDAFMITSKKHGIEVHNADPEFWPGTSWQDKHWFRKTEAQYRFTVDHPEYTHFLFCDSYDCCFAAGWDEIVEKFKALKSPLVFAAECYPWPDTKQSELYPPTIHRCKYLNAGFWMGEATAAREFLRDASAIAGKREKCDQGIFVDLFLTKRHPMELDRTCSICFCCNMDSLTFLESRDGRPTCTDTSEKPCLFHGNGNSDLMTVLKML